jgi:hypothetical protein
MFENDTNADDAVSRRSVLQTTGGLLAGGTALAGLGAGTGAAETGEGLRLEVREMTEEYVAVEVWFPNDVFDEVEFPTDIFLGHAERFVLHEEEGAVSLPEDVEVLATPVEMDFGNPHDVVMYFRTEQVDLSAADGEEVVLGLGAFSERTIPKRRWDACPGHRDY